MASPTLTSIRGYELRDRIGKGGFGEVYRAYQPAVGREVAIKVIQPQYANDPDFIRRFEVEAQLVARLEHPYIVPLYDYWREPDGAYLVMRYLRAGSLRDALNRSAWTPEMALRLLDQIASALMAAHRQGVIHRDVKPENILLDEDGNAYLTDFGIAKDIERFTRQSKTGSITGSLAYISPEQVQSKPVASGSDLYSLGIVLYEVLAGEHPFSGETPSGLLLKHLNEPVPSLHGRGLPPALDDVIQHATAKDPTQRYADMLAFAADFRAALGKNIPTAAGPELEAPLAAPNPYKGLHAFQEADAPDFFGREALIERLLQRMKDDSPLSRFLAVVGPSGSGKSSVVKAGLLPALRRGMIPGSHEWYVVEMVPGAHPLEELEIGLIRIAADKPAGLMEQLRRDERGLLRAARLVLPSDDATLLLILDQFEEIFTLVENKPEATHFLNSLYAAVTDPRSPVRVLLTLRADFYDRPLMYPDFSELMRQRTEVVLPLSADELARAITSPAERVGARFEPGLVAAMVVDVKDQPGALPLLQYALTELFERRQGRQLTRQSYQAMGSVMGVLGRRADEVYERLTADEQAAAQQLFLRLVTLGEGVEDTRRRVARAELEALQSPPPSGSPHLKTTNGGSGDTDPTPVLPIAALRAGISSLPIGGFPMGRAGVGSVLEAFGRARLLAFDRDPLTRGPTVEVAHEALLREWKRLREWLDASRTEVRLQRLLAAAAAEWVSCGRDASFLLQGARLAQFEGWAATTHLALTQDERAYLQASLEERQHREEAETLRQQQELAAAHKLADVERARAEAEQQRAEEQMKAAKRLRLRNRALTFVGLVAVLLAVIAGVFGLQANHNAQVASQNLITAQVANTQTAQQQATAEANFTRAESQRLAAEANALVKSNASSELIALLALRSMNLQYSPQGDMALMSAASLAYPSQIFMGHELHVNAVALSPDGKYALTGGIDQTARLWDVPTGKIIHQFDHDQPVRFVALSPDNRYALTGDEHESRSAFRVRIWDVQTGKEIGQFAPSAPIYSAIFSADSRTVLIGCGDATVQIWDWRMGHDTHIISLPTRQAEAVWAITPDGRYAMTRTLSGYTMRLWELGETIRQLQEFTYASSVVVMPSNPFSFSSDGKYVLIGDGDGATHLWDTFSGKEIRTFKGNGLSVYSVAFSLDSKQVIVSSQDKTVRIWDCQTGEERYRLPQSDDIWSLAFSPDGNSVLLGSLTGAVRIWNIPPRSEFPDFGHFTGPVAGIAISPDGKSLAVSVASGEGELTLWDMDTGKLQQLLAKAEFINFAVRFSPDGRYLLSGNYSGVARLWDVATGEEARQFTYPSSMNIYDVAFSPDGKQILIGGPDPDLRVAIAKVWNVQTGELLTSLYLPADDDAIFRVAFSPDGQFMLTTHGLPPSARLWKAGNGKELRQFIGHTTWVTGAGFSPDGKYIVTASYDKTARLWDVQTGKEIRQFIGHTEGLWSVAFSPDGKTIATASTDGTARLWNVETGDELRRFAGHTAGLENVVFSPDGKIIATASDDGTVRLWDVDYHMTMQYLCSRLLRDFTDDERAQYNITGDEPTCPQP
jgi:WD40 repeat protein